MADINDGEVVYVQGSGAAPYELKNIGGVYSCSCPAWRNAGGGIDKRTCKHLKAVRGEQAEIDRLGADFVATRKPTAPKAPKPAGAPTSDDDDDAASGTAPPVLLAHRWENDVDLTGWWMSEKLDGVRAWWDGTRFMSRLGNPFYAPSWFTAGLPSTTLDGELWVGRKEFQTTVSIVRRQDGSTEWKKVQFLVFDAPHLQVPFEDRVEHIKQFAASGVAPYVRAVDHVPCQGTPHLKQELARVEALGGEGLMMRRPKSHYEAGRSTSLLKVKTFHDAEGRVVGHDPGKGKHKGRLGALVVEMPDGTRFNVGTGLTDQERNQPPSIGTIITYRYQELSKDGVPRFPSYVGLAIDKAGPTAATKPQATSGINPARPSATKPAASAAPAAPSVAASSSAPPAPSAKKAAPVRLSKEERQKAMLAGFNAAKNKRNPAP